MDEVKILAVEPGWFNQVSEMPPHQDVAAFPEQRQGHYNLPSIWNNG